MPIKQNNVCKTIITKTALMMQDFNFTNEHNAVYLHHNPIVIATRGLGERMQSSGNQTTARPSQLFI